MNQERHEMKQLWPNLRCCAVICLQRLRKTTKNLRINGLKDKIFTQDLQNMKQKC
jgi:hypothetical protein